MKTEKTGFTPFAGTSDTRSTESVAPVLSFLDHPWEVPPDFFGLFWLFCASCDLTTYTTSLYPPSPVRHDNFLATHGVRERLWADL